MCTWCDGGTVNTPAAGLTPAPPGTEGVRPPPAGCARRTGGPPLHPLPSATQPPPPPPPPPPITLPPLDVEAEEEEVEYVEYVEY